MKRWMSLILILIAVLMVACGGGAADAPPADDSAAAPDAQADAQAAADTQQEPEADEAESVEPTPDVPPPTDEPTPEPIVDPTAVPTEEPTAEAVVEDPVTGESWMIFSTSADGVTIDSVYAVSEDGSDVRQLASNLQVLVPFDWNLSKSISPDGKRMAVITTSDPATLKDLTLFVISIPDGGVTLVTPLTSETTEPTGDPSIDDPNLQIARSISEVPNMAWSADGQYLAFTGAIVGSSADIYVWNTEANSIAQVTGEDAQAINPTFSPDGANVVFTTVSGLGTGAGFGVQDVRVVNIESLESRVLYEAQSGNEDYLGWLTDSGVVVYSWDVICGTNNIRVVDVNTGAVTPLWADYYAMAAYDEATGTGLVAVDRLTESCSEELTAGLFRVSALSGVEQVFEGQAFEVTWVPEADRFFARITDGLLVSVPLAGQTLPYDGPPYARFDVSDSGQDIAFAGMGFSDTPQGVYIGALDGNYVLYADTPFDYPQWAPDGSRVFTFGSDGTIVMFVGPDYNPTEITSGVTLSNWGPVWVTIE